MKRREFTIHLSSVLAAIMIPFKHVFGALPANETIWNELVEYARWCPSPHNTQPWKVKVISEMEADLYYDPKRIPTAVDGTTSYTTVGIGMFIECLSIAAYSRGFKIIEEHSNEYELKTEGNRLEYFSKLRLSPTVKSPEFDRELIKKRRTSRLKYDHQVIDNEVVQGLKKIANQFGHKLTYTSNRKLIDDAINLNSQSILDRSQDFGVQKEMLNWIRGNNRIAAQKKDGWWYKCTGFSGRQLINFFSQPERIERNRERTVKMLNNSMKGTANLAWISGPFETKSDWIKSGAMLQRIWLEITKQKGYLSPLGPVVTTPKSLMQFKDNIGYKEEEGPLWFLIRIGHGKVPVRSFRLEASEILI